MGEFRSDAHANKVTGSTHLEVLAGDFDLVKLPVVELGQVASTLVECLLPWAPVEVALVLVAPALELDEVRLKRRLAEKVVLDRLLEGLRDVRALGKVLETFSRLVAQAVVVVGLVAPLHVLLQVRQKEHQPMVSLCDEEVKGNVPDGHRAGERTKSGKCPPPEVACPDC